MNITKQFLVIFWSTIVLFLHAMENSDYFSKEAPPLPLNKDVAEHIIRKVIGNEEQPRSIPSSSVTDEPKLRSCVITTEKKIEKTDPVILHSQPTLMSCNWNRLRVTANIDSLGPRFNMKARQANNLADIIVLIDHTDASCKNLISSKYTAQQTNRYCFDGPNDDDVLLITQDMQNISHYQTICHLIKAEAIHDNGTTRLIELQKTSLMGHSMHSLALARKKIFAIASAVRNSTRDWLSFYSYLPETQKIILIKQAHLHESLKKIAFIVNSTLIGLTSTGNLYFYWLDQENKINKAHQNIPAYKIVDFAVDPINRGLVALALQNEDGKIKLALAHVNNRNEKSNILFKILDSSHEIKADVTLRQFTLHNGFICHTGNPQISKDPRFSPVCPHYFTRIISSVALKKDLCYPSKH